MSKPTLEHCVELITAGIAKRSRRVDVPGEVAVSNWTRQLLVSGLAEPIIAKMARTMVSQMEREVDDLGRAHSAHIPVTKKH